MFYHRSWHYIQASQRNGTVAEIVPPNNSSAIHARYLSLTRTYSVPLTLCSDSIFHHANNTVVSGGTFYAAHNLSIKQGQGEKLP